MDSFKNNLGILSSDEQHRLQASHVLLVGLGGLGGHLANSLVRCGVKNLLLVDPDCYEGSNLNRQLFSTESTIGKPKVEVVKEALLEIQSSINIETYQSRIEEVNLDQCASFDMVIDAVDSIATRLYLEQLTTHMNCPLLHGAIGGWYGQLGIIMPGKDMLKDMYGSAKEGLEEQLKSPTFTPAIIANMMVVEFVKYRIGSPKALINKILGVDVLNHSYHVLFDRN